MEVISIEKSAFEAMMARFESFAREVEKLMKQHGVKKLDGYYDTQDVCLMLGISPRSVQVLRESHRLGYCRIDGKILYKPREVGKLVAGMHKKQ